ncbi:MAG: UDP-N-acetylmuramate dehydrogenase [Candidatus Kapaibacteriales bacterium]
MESIPNTFGIASYCNSLIYISNEDDIEVKLKKYNNTEEYFILGEGSNVLLADKIDRDIIIFQNNDINVSEEDDNVLITVGSGFNWHELVLYCARKGYHGFENLALIPGNVGAAPVQNIGAYGVEQEEHFVSLRGYDILDKSFQTLIKEDCRFGYRDSIFKNELKGRFLITSVTYSLSNVFNPNLSYAGVNEYLAGKGIEKPNATQFVDAISAIRRSKLPYPDQIGNAGSFFKNPIVTSEIVKALKIEYPELRYFPFQDSFKLSAAWLIETSGWKGKNYGGAGVYANHALILVNHSGNAKGKELFELSEQIIKDVESKFGVKLEREVNLVGF